MYDKVNKKFTARGFDGCHVLIARGRDGLKDWAYEEKVAIVPACASCTEADLDNHEVRAAVIPPLIGKIPREEPNLNIHTEEIMKQVKATHWKTLAVINCISRDDGKYNLILRGRDATNRKPYTWDSVKRRQDPTSNDTFDDFTLVVTKNDFMYKYLAPMIHTSIFDGGPREVRTTISFPSDDAKGLDFVVLRPRRR